MAVRRMNILSSVTLQQDFINACKLLKAEVPANGGLSTWDVFVVWHQRAMMTPTPAGQGARNAAHGGPVFLPWHRYMLVLMERNMQRVLNDSNFGLPYWDWATDGQLAAANQVSAPLWGIIGGSGSPVTTGPFSETRWRVRVEMNPNTGRLVDVDRGLNRALGTLAPRLPDRTAVGAAMARVRYDTRPWSPSSSSSFRNELEGWAPSPPGLHNLVHVWVGGDMLLSTSPNDPVFYLNHCNVDRIWSEWQNNNGATTYQPQATDSTAPSRHRPNDLLFPLRSRGPRVREMFDVTSTYTYA